MTRRKLLAGAIVAVGAIVLTWAQFGMRAPEGSPMFKEGRVEHDKAGHNQRQLLAAGAGVALVLAGGILLISQDG
jgi:hypothetical protein